MWCWTCRSVGMLSLLLLAPTLVAAVDIKRSGSKQEHFVVSADGIPSPSNAARHNPSEEMEMYMSKGGGSTNALNGSLVNFALGICYEYTPPSSPSWNVSKDGDFVTQCLKNPDFYQATDRFYDGKTCAQVDVIVATKIASEEAKFWTAFQSNVTKYLTGVQNATNPTANSTKAFKEWMDSFWSGVTKQTTAQQQEWSNYSTWWRHGPAGGKHMGSHPHFSFVKRYVWGCQMQNLADMLRHPNNVSYNGAVSLLPAKCQAFASDANPQASVNLEMSRAFEVDSQGNSRVVRNTGHKHPDALSTDAPEQSAVRVSHHDPSQKIETYKMEMGTSTKKAAIVNLAAGLCYEYDGSRSSFNGSFTMECIQKLEKNFDSNLANITVFYREGKTCPEVDAEFKAKWDARSCPTYTSPAWTNSTAYINWTQSSQFETWNASLTNFTRRETTLKKMGKHPLYTSVTIYARGAQTQNLIEAFLNVTNSSTLRTNANATSWFPKKCLPTTASR